MDEIEAGSGSVDILHLGAADAGGNGEKIGSRFPPGMIEREAKARSLDCGARRGMTDLFMRRLLDPGNDHSGQLEKNCFRTRKGRSILGQRCDRWVARSERVRSRVKEFAGFGDAR